MADPQEGASQDQTAPVRESMDYDLVIVDPPAFGVGRGNERVLRLLWPDLFASLLAMAPRQVVLMSNDKAFRSRQSFTELVQAELVSSGRAAVRATAWRLQKSDTTAIEGIEDERMSGPDENVEPVTISEWPGGYIQSVEIRPVPGHRPGRGRAWLRTKHPLVDGEDFTELSRLIGMIDTSNGIATRVRPGSYLFPNVDLQLHLYREPTGDWLGLQNSVSFGADGIGLTSTVLYDATGPFGRAEQILTLRTPN